MEAPVNETSLTPAAFTHASSPDEGILHLVPNSLVEIQLLQERSPMLEFQQGLEKHLHNTGTG